VPPPGLVSHALAMGLKKHTCIQEDNRIPTLRRGSSQSTFSTQRYSETHSEAIVLAHHVGCCSFWLRNNKQSFNAVVFNVNARELGAFHGKSQTCLHNAKGLGIPDGRDTEDDFKLPAAVDALLRELRLGVS